MINLKIIFQLSLAQAIVCFMESLKFEKYSSTTNFCFNTGFIFKKNILQVLAIAVDFFYLYSCLSRSKVNFGNEMLPMPDEFPQELDKVSSFFCVLLNLRMVFDSIFLGCVSSMR